MSLLELPDELDLRAASSKVLYQDGGVMESRARRPWDRITGIVLHQTACVLGERPARWHNVGAHYGVTRGGQRLRLHDEDERVVHGHGFNNMCVGIEGDGLYAGVEGDPNTVWDDPTTKIRERGMLLTQELIAAYRETIRAIVRRVAEHGGKIKFLLAHRQSSTNRRNDPGEAIWRAVAIPMMDELELSSGGEKFSIGDGRAIPQVWDERAKGVAY